MSFPDIHGDQIVFTCEGDLWLGSLSGGSAVRITRDAMEEEYAKFSPDGKWIAFTGAYDGSREVYVMPSEGGVPRKLTSRFTYAEVMDWTPDGRSILFRSHSIPRSVGLFLVPAEGGEPEKMPLEFASDAGFGSNGDEIVWTRFLRADDAWFRYTGGMQNQIWKGNRRTRTFQKLTEQPGTNEYPFWTGDTVGFVNERDGKFTLMAVSPAGGRARPLAPPSNFEITHPSAHGDRVIYRKGFGIEILDLKTGVAQPVTMKMASDDLHTRPFMVPAEPAVSAGSATPTGKRVLLEARGQIVSAPIGEGEARVWKAIPGARLRNPVMSPKGDKVAYFSDESGEMQLMIADAEGHNARALTQDRVGRLITIDWSPDGSHIVLQDSESNMRMIDVASGKATLLGKTMEPWNGLLVSFSPDSKWLAYHERAAVTGFGSIIIFEIATGRKERLGRNLANDIAPAFSSDGQYLVFLSARNLAVSWDPILNQNNTSNVVVANLIPLRADAESPFAPQDPVEASEKPAEKKDEPFRIDWDGLYQRRVEIPLPPGTYSEIDLVGGRVLVQGQGSVHSYDIAKKALGTVTTGGKYMVTADAKKLMVTPGFRVIDITANDVAPTLGRPTYGNLRLQIDPVQEWRQIYWDAWRTNRDYFYVKNMHGLDWPAIGKKYGDLLPMVRSHGDLMTIIRWLQAELGVSHAYLQPGDGRMLKTPVAGGFLGIDVVADPSGYYRISDIMTGDGFLTTEQSPLLAPGSGVKVGHYLIEVAGVPAKVGTDYHDALAGRVGQIVTVKVNSTPSPVGAKTIRLKPVSIQADLRMRRVTWAERNRLRVYEATGGKVGYIYLQAMTAQDTMDFIKMFYAQQNMDGIIVDTRFNNGGNTQSIINRILAEKLSGLFNMRNGFDWSRQGDYFLGPKVMIQNEFNVSCGEEFPHRWRDLGLGKIIGRRTYGGEVGSSPGWPMADGTIVSVPNYGMYTPKDGWVIESTGVDPDIDVVNDPNAYAAGKDLQLEKAIEVVLDELRRNPVVRPKQPADPVKAKNGGG